MGKIKTELDKVTGVETTSRTAGDAIRNLGATKEVTTDELTVSTKITLGETALTEEQLTALLALI